MNGKKEKRREWNGEKNSHKKQSECGEIILPFD
jgi:hypothetical protein